MWEWDERGMGEGEGELASISVFTGVKVPRSPDKSLVGTVHQRVLAESLGRSWLRGAKAEIGGDRRTCRGLLRKGVSTLNTLWSHVYSENIIKYHKIAIKSQKIPEKIFKNARRCRIFRGTVLNIL